MNPTRMAEKPMFPTHRSNPSDGEPDAVKVARPVRRGGMAQTSRSSPGHRRRRPYPMQLDECRTQANYAGEGMYAPDDDGGKLMFPTLVYPI